MHHEHGDKKLAPIHQDEPATVVPSGVLARHVDALNALIIEMIATLPIGPIEIAFLSVGSSLQPDTGDLGTVFTPCGVLAHHVELRCMPKHVRPWPGRTLQFELILSDDYPCTAPAELEAAAAALVPHVHVDVSLVCGEVSQTLLVTLAPAAGGRSVGVSVPVPESADRDSKVVIRGISVAGQPVTHGQSLPALVDVFTGMLAPLRLEGAAGTDSCTPVISGDGTLYSAMFRKSDMVVFLADGTPLPSLHFASLGLSTRTSDVAFDEPTSTLLLSDANEEDSKLVAVEAVSRAIRWSTFLRSDCCGIAVLPAQGLVAASIVRDSQVRVFLLSNGTLVASAHADGPSFIATDPTSASTLFVSTETKVSAFIWAESALVSEGVVEAADVTDDWRPLAVVPPAPGQRISYLVVGTCGTPTLLVLSLPGRRLVHTHTLEEMEIRGLASDPSGTALAVCDSASQAVHVLSWPLPGMPPLQ
jgi:hypothetical protein